MSTSKLRESEWFEENFLSSKISLYLITEKIQLFSSQAASKPYIYLVQ